MASYLKGRAAMKEFPRGKVAQSFLINHSTQLTRSEHICLLKPIPRLSFVATPLILRREFVGNSYLDKCESVRVSGTKLQYEIP